MAGEVTFTATQADWVAANRLWAWHSRQARIFRWLGPAVLVFAAFEVALRYWMGDRLEAAVLDAVPFLLAGVISFGLPAVTRLLVPRAVRRMFEQRPSMADPITAGWDGERFTFSSPSAHNHQPWRTLHRWLGDGRSIVLLPTDQMMMLVPTRVLLPEQQADLVQHLERHRPAG